MKQTIVTELVIDARPATDGANDYERALKKASSAANRAADAEQRLQDKVDQARAVQQRSATLIAERSNAYDRLRAKVDAQFALEQRLTAARAQADRAVRSGQATQAQATATLEAYKAKQERLLGIVPKVAAANDNLVGSFAAMGGMASRVGPAIALLSSALAVIGSGAALAGIAKAGLQMESLERGFAAAAGSAEQGSREFTFIRDAADRLGLALGETSTQYLGFLAASRGTVLQGQAARDIFIAVTSAMGALGKDSETTSRALIAVQQMMSKGKISAEEMTGQLGEALPGALSLSAKAMGMTQQALLKLMGDGKLYAADLLPKLEKQLTATYGEAAAKAANGLQANTNRMKTAWTDLQDTIARNGFNDALSRAAGDMAAFLKSGKDGAAEFGRTLASVVDTLRGVGAAAVDAYDSAKIILQMINEFDDALNGKTIDYGSLTSSGTSGIAELLQTALEFDKAYINKMIGVFVAGYDMAVAAWDGLPAAFGGLGSSAANALISAIEGAVNFAIRGFNSIVEAVNSIGASLPGFSNLSKAAEVTFGRIEAASSKTVGQVASDVANVGKAALSRDYLGEAGTAIVNRFNELKDASRTAREERKRLADQAAGDKLADALKNTGNGAKQAAEDLDKAGKAAKQAEKDFEKIRDAAEKAFEKLYPEEALKKRGEEHLKLLEQFREKLNALDPRLAPALEIEIKANLGGKEIEGVKHKANDLSSEMSQTFRGVFDDMFTNAGKGLDGLLDSITKGFSRIGSRLVEKNLIEPLFSGKGGEGGGSGGFLGFSLSDLRSTFRDGFGQGFDDTFGPLLEPAKNSKGESMGFGSSKLGAGLTSGLAGASIGYSTQNPLIGAVGGGLAGFAAGAAAGGTMGPIGAVIGAGAGLIGGSMGQRPASKRKRDNERRERVREFEACGDADGFVAVPA